MKILMLNGTYGGISGSGRAVKLLSEKLVEKGFKVGVFANTTVGYINVPKLKSISFAVLAKLKEKKNWDVIHVHNPKFAVSVGKNTRNILTVHGDFLTEFRIAYGSITSNLLNTVLENEFRKFDKITCVSPYWASLRGWEYIPNGLDLSEIEDIHPSPEKYVLFVGRKDEIKGYDLFEAAMKKTAYPYKMLGVYEKAPWSQVISYMKSAHCLVLPSRQEGMPYVVLEAWASGCPIIATNLQTLRSFGEDAIHFLKERSVKEILKSLKNLIEDRDLKEKLVKQGFEKIKQFSIETMSEQYIKLYNDVL